MSPTLLEAYRALLLRDRIIAVAYKFDIGLSIEEISEKLVIEQDVLRCLYRTVIEKVNFSTKLGDLLNALENTTNDFALEEPEELDDDQSSLIDAKEESLEVDDQRSEVVAASASISSYSSKRSRPPASDEGQEAPVFDDVLDDSVELSGMRPKRISRKDSAQPSGRAAKISERQATPWASDYESDSSFTPDQEPSMDDGVHSSPGTLSDEFDGEKSERSRRKKSSTSDAEQHSPTHPQGAGSSRKRGRSHTDLDPQAEASSGPARKKSIRARGPHAPEKLRQPMPAPDAYYARSYTMSEEAWDALRNGTSSQKRRARQMSHVGRIEETRDGMPRAAGKCKVCEMKGYESCRTYTERALHEYQGKDVGVSSCGMCRYKGRHCEDYEGRPVPKKIWKTRCRAERKSSG
ncbi:hypothetical protein HII31_06844 [Pseudocercospora fuligena]|uniref:Uncharacterized protein n=1 Tax=Pseudocercospora fuligena TaxID=685502 RepID=A0A8H6RHV4_9PEZI|nr:hypothetical protein HII31_06844 [Pseudocercospora fuligena]